MAGEIILHGAVYLQSQMAMTIRDATIPIFILFGDEKLKANRSAVFLRIEDEHFLLSATHFIPEAIGLDYRVFTQPAVDGPMVELTSIRLTMMDGVADVCIARLTRDHVRLMGHIPIVLTDIDRKFHYDETDSFIMCGFPIVWDTRTPSAMGEIITPRPFTLLTHGYDGQIAKPEDFNHKLHLCVDWSNNFHPLQFDSKPTTTSKLIETPDSRGLSGGGIWRVGLHTESLPPSGDNLARRLTAIQTEVCPELEYAQGTFAWLAVFLIWQQWTHLRPAIEKAFPIFPTLPSFPVRNYD